MKKRALCIAICGIFIGDAQAQSSVTLYGIIDVGVNYINNDNGKSNIDLTSGMVRGSRFGLKGTEDLGGGLSAVFQLENGFSATNGSLGQGGRLFGRQAWVGLKSTSFGSITMGRQYDSVVDYVQPMAGLVYTGITHPFDNDNLINSFRINNSIKYTSPDFHGVRFGGLYGFSNSASSGSPGTGFASNRAWSAGASYNGGMVSVGAGYLHLNLPNSNTSGAVVGDYINVTDSSPLGSNGLASPVVREDIAAAGIAVFAGSLKAGFVYSHSRFESENDRLSFDNYEVNANYFITPTISVTGIYSFTDGKLHSTNSSPKYHQVQLMGDYLLSKRTDVYLLGVYQRAAGDAEKASIAPDTFGSGGTSAPDASTTQNQVMVRLGIRHLF